MFFVTSDMKEYDKVKLYVFPSYGVVLWTKMDCRLITVLGFSKWVSNGNNHILLQSVVIFSVHSESSIVYY